MYAKKPLGLRKKGVILGAIAIAFLFISQTTAVAQVQGSAVVDQIEQYHQTNDITSLLFNLKNTNTDNTALSYLYLLILLDEKLIDAITQPEDISISFTQLGEELENQEITETILVEKTQDCVVSLEESINALMQSDDLSPEKRTALQSLESLLATLQSLLENKNILNNGGGGGGGFFEKLLSILLTLLLIPLIIIKGIIKAAIGILGGLLKILSALVGIVVLMFLGLQAGLTLTAFFVLLMGVISKIGIKVFAVIAAPIFALLAAQITVLAGSVLGGISLALHSLIAIALIFAIPLAIVAILGLLASGGSDGDGGGFLYMILSVLANRFKSTS